MPILIPKRTMESDESRFGVCVWRFPDGSYLMNDDQEYYSIQGKPFDKKIEQRMDHCAHRDFGDLKGKPWWLPGFRKITQSEWEDQMEILQGGGIPDPVDLARQIEHG